MKRGIDMAYGRPPFVIEDYFEGETLGWGVQQTRFGALRSQFEIRATGTWDAAAQSLSLVEVYTFEDGFIDRLEWTIVKRSATIYRGFEPLVAAPAWGEQRANWFRWHYRRRTPRNGGGRTLLGYDDCFWLQNDGVLIARASVSRFGLEVATLSVFYAKP